jgi:hypothetical protein
MNPDDFTADELFETLGRELTGHQALPLPKNEAIKRGRRWFEANVQRFRSAVCDNPASTAVMNASDSSALVTAIADLIVGYCTGVSPVTVASIVLKIGFTKFCENEKEQ